MAGSDAYPFRLSLDYGKTMKEAEKVRLAEVLAEGWQEVKGNPKHMYVGIYGDRRLKRTLRARAEEKNCLIQSAGVSKATSLAPPTKAWFDPKTPLQLLQKQQLPQQANNFDALLLCKSSQSSVG